MTDEFAGYENVQRFYRGREHAVLRAVRSSDLRPVVIKVVLPECIHTIANDVIEHEFQVMRTLSFPGVIKALNLETFGRQSAIVMEDGGTATLTSLIQRKALDLKTFLPVAIELVEIILRIHEAGFVHGSLSPANVLLNVSNGHLKVVDFGAAARSGEFSMVSPPGESTVLAYTSPEQSGRIGATVDQRSDLYALGAVFYELLSGAPPFVSDDPLAVIHAHLSVLPQFLTKKCPDIPLTVAQIIHKLLAKSPDERYQGAYGLLSDLVQVKYKIDQGHNLDSVQIGSQDKPHNPVASRKFYGRENEADVLRSVWNVSKDQGKVSLVWVTGPSGIGKTTFVNEVCAPLAEDNGLFLFGKFDQSKRNIPFSTIGQTFSPLMRKLLTESEEQMALWKGQIEEALGPNGALIARVLPQIELLIGPQPNLVTLSPVEEKTRFENIIVKFLGVFARERSPLILFLDDLQWASPDELAFISTLATNGCGLHLLLIGSYRSNELVPGHPLLLMLEELGQKKNEGIIDAVLETIELGPLGEEALNELVADTLHTTDDAVQNLSKLVAEKTHGNPFFAIQFLQTLHQEQLLLFDKQNNRWTWEPVDVAAQKHADNIVDLLLAKSQKLPSATRNLLKGAACLGASADVRTLASVLEKTTEESERDLLPAISAGLIFVRDGAYKFLHDQVQNAAYALIPTESRASEHLKIARILLAQTSAASLDEHIFDIVNQFALGAAMIDDLEERYTVANLYLLAGNKARLNNAFVSAIRFFSTGVDLVSKERDNQPERSRDLFFELSFQLASSFWQNLQNDEARNCLTCLEDAGLPLTTVQRALMQRLWTDIYTNCFFLGEAINAGLKGLSLLGIDIARDSGPAEVECELRQVWTNLGTRQIEDLIDLPLMSDPEKLVAVSIIRSLYAASLYHHDRNIQTLFLLLACKIVNLSMQYGNCDSSAAGYAYLGQGLCALGQCKEGYRLGKMALNLTEYRGLSAYRPSVEMAMSFISFWTKPFKNSLPYLYSASETSAKTCDGTMFALTQVRSLVTKFVIGEPLKQMYDNCSTCLDKTNFSQVKSVKALTECIQRFSLNMRGLTRNFSTFDDDLFDTLANEAYLQETCQPVISCFFQVMQLEARFLSGDVQEAIEAGYKAYDLLWSSRTHLHGVEYYFYMALAVAARFKDVDTEKQSVYKKLLTEHQEQLTKWTISCPENWRHKSALVCAEIARLEGRDLDAQRFYEEAVSQAHLNGFSQDEGIACELAGNYYAERGFSTISISYYKEARSCFARWGADGKVAQLELLHPAISNGWAPERTLDMMTVFKATQAISKEVVLEQLLGTLMHVAVEAAGAQNGVLLLNEPGGLVVRAHTYAKSLEEQTEDVDPSNCEKDKTRVVVEAVALKDFPHLPLSVVNYVSRTLETVVLGDALSEPVFGRDKHFSKDFNYSVFCLPIVKQSKLLSVLYLENNLAAKIFTKERINLLELLSGQISTSLENGMLFDGLRQEIEERKRAEAALRESEQRIRLLNQDLEARVLARTAELCHATEEADAANQAKGEFIATISHEIRTPMNAVIGISDLLSRTPLNSEQADFVSTLQQSADMLLNLISNILDYSKIEAGKYELEKTEFDIHSIVESCAEMLSEKAGSKNITLVVSISNAIPSVLRGDQTSIRQVLLNLLSNSIKFTEKGNVFLKVEPHEQYATNNLIVFSVIDTGIGMNAKVLSRLFNPFTQADGSITRRYGGTGLGLSISKRLVEIMGGELTAQSEEGMGSKFIFAIPLHATDSAQSSGPNIATAAESNLENKRVLLVSRLESLNHMTTEYVSPWGIKLKIVDNGADAHIEMLKAVCAHEPYDLVLIEMLNSGCQLKLCKELRADSAIRKSKICLVSAQLAEKTDTQTLHEADETLVLPVRKKRFSEMLARMLDDSFEQVVAQEKMDEKKIQDIHFAPVGYSALGTEPRASETASVLIVEDNPVNRKLALAQLKELGIAAHTVNDGRSAVDAVKTNSYSLVFMDCQMPEMDGFEATQIIRLMERDSGLHVPIVAMTAQASDADRDRCLQAGMDDYLTKPVTSRKLFDVLNRWVLQADY
ncbi:MAG: AAA family ATPase [Candidatus Obscuribacterales bacterium]|nr:AAA family ATPase [Candidatus Obscuribacterales bacterium]